MDDLDALMDPALPLPIGGVEYRVHCSAHQGLHLFRLFESGLRLNDDTERAEIQRMLGPAYQQMLDNKVPWPSIVRAGRTAIFHFGHSPKLGERIWKSGDVSGNPIPPKPKRRRKRRRFRGSAAATGSARGH